VPSVKGKKANVVSLLLALVVIVGIAAAVHLVGRQQLIESPEGGTPATVDAPAVATPETPVATGPTVIYECVRDGVRTFSDHDCGPGSTARVLEQEMDDDTGLSEDGPARRP